jgi:endonuclease-3
LHAQYPGNPTPSLRFADPYQCVVAIALSAQTTDNNVNRVTPTLFARWPDVAALATANQAELEAVIHPLGFFHVKAQNLLGLARRVRDVYGGQIPDTMDALTTLPGVARKTANLVMLESFGRVCGIAVDTHVFRISHRLRLSRAKTPAQTEGDLCKAFPYEAWARVNFEMINHGRQVCIARRPKCSVCVLADLCPSAGKENK